MPRIDPNEEYYVWPEGEAYSEHDEHAFCYDMSCPCHENQSNIDQLGQQHNDGLVSTDDANRIYRGRTV